MVLSDQKSMMSIKINAFKTFFINCIIIKNLWCFKQMWNWPKFLPLDINRAKINHEIIEPCLIWYFELISHINSMLIQKVNIRSALLWLDIFFIDLMIYVYLKSIKDCSIIFYFVSLNVFLFNLHNLLFFFVVVRQILFWSVKLEIFV